MSVNIVNVDVAALDVALQKFCLKRTGTKEERIAALTAHFAKLPKEKLSKCDVCGGVSASDLPACPFCGAGDEEEDDAKGKKAAPAGKAKPEAGKPAAAHLALVLKPAAALSQFSVKDLEANVETINKFQTDAIRCTWELGSAIKDNYTNELWKLSADKDGTPKYTNVKAFWAEEFGFSHVYCYDLMQMATVFTKDDVAKIGPTKCRVIMTAPEDHQVKLLERAKKDNPSVSQLKDVVDKLKGKTKGAAASGKKDRKDRITLAVAPHRKTIALKARAKKPGDPPVSAKRIADAPWCEYELENGVILKLNIGLNERSEMVAVFEFKRTK